MVIDFIGRLRMIEAVPELVKIFNKRSVFFKKRNNMLRLEACKALERIGTDEAIAVLQKGARDQSRAVRELCAALIKPKGA